MLPFTAWRSRGALDAFMPGVALGAWRPLVAGQTLGSRRPCHTRPERLICQLVLRCVQPFSASCQPRHARRPRETRRPLGARLPWAPRLASLPRESRQANFPWGPPLSFLSLGPRGPRGAGDGWADALREVASHLRKGGSCPGGGHCWRWTLCSCLDLQELLFLLRAPLEEPRGGAGGRGWRRLVSCFPGGLRPTPCSLLEHQRLALGGRPQGGFAQQDFPRRLCLASVPLFPLLWGALCRCRAGGGRGWGRCGQPGAQREPLGRAGGSPDAQQQQDTQAAEEEAAPGGPHGAMLGTGCPGHLPAPWPLPGSLCLPSA